MRPCWTPIVRLFVGAFLLATVFGVLLVHPAHAAASLLDCTGTVVADYDPALTNTQQNVTIRESEDFDLCSIAPQGLNAGDGAITLHNIPADCLVNAPITSA